MKSLTKNQLTPEEKTRLAELQPIIQRGLKNFKEVGDALAEVSDRRLYRETHSTFKEFVETQYGISVSRAYQLCDAAAVVKLLPEKVSTLVDTERKARELLGASEADRPKIVKAAAKKAKRENRSVTAKDFAEEVAAKSPKPAAAPEPTPPDDDEGHALQGFRIDVQACLATIPEGANLSPYIEILRTAARTLEKQALQAAPRPGSWFKAYTNSK